jgi:hypothetical protein
MKVFYLDFVRDNYFSRISSVSYHAYRAMSKCSEIYNVKWHLLSFSLEKISELKQYLYYKKRILTADEKEKCSD